MAPRALRVCTTVGCPAFVVSGKCPECRAEADARRRKTSEQVAYKRAPHKAFRRAVLSRDPICTICQQAPSVVADHHPVSRRDLVAKGLDPNDPSRGRGVCTTCHNRSTARHQPGGWAQLIDYHDDETDRPA